MTTPSRKFIEDEIRRILYVASSHKDQRAAASISLLLALSVPLYVQESLLWRNFAVVRGGTSITVTGRLLKLDVHLGTAPARHLTNLRTVSNDTRVFGKLTKDSPNLRPLVEQLLISANVSGCSHRDLVEWSRRQTDAFRRSL
jgi:hypothetical protein